MLDLAFSSSFAESTFGLRHTRVSVSPLCCAPASREVLTVLLAFVTERQKLHLAAEQRWYTVVEVLLNRSLVYVWEEERWVFLAH